MKKILLALSILLLASCATTDLVDSDAGLSKDTTMTVETVYRCTYKYDSKYNLTFLGSKRTEYNPPMFPQLLVHHITDVRGTKWSINQYDWENYTCIPSLTQGK